MVYTSLEYGQMVFVYGFCNGNAAAASREYARRYPNRVAPSPRVFSRAYQRLCETGSILHTREGQGVPPNIFNNVGLVENVLNAFDEDPTTSVRRVALQ